MTHDGDKSYQCPICGKEFTKPQTMKTHIRVHTGERPFRCSYCPKAFTTSGNLGDHLRVHSAARLFKCKICGAKFKRNATLKRHLDLHTKYKQDKDCEEIIVSRNAGEILHAEEVNDKIYFSRIDRTPEIIISEDGAAVQTGAHHLNHVIFDDFNNQHPQTIELFFPPMSDREDQDSFLHNPIEIKEEKWDDFHDATVLELTEELDLENGQIKVSFPENYSQNLVSHVVGDTGEEEEVITSYELNISKDRTFSTEVTNIPKDRTFSNELTNIPKDRTFSTEPTKAKACEDQGNSDRVQSDLAKNYGAYVAKMLRLIQSKEKQVLLIKDLNHALHEFLIENR